MTRPRRAFLIIGVAVGFAALGVMVQDAVVDRIRGTLLGDVAGDLYLGWGMARTVVGDPAGAVADYERASRLHPQSVSVRYLRGLANTQMEDHAAAVADFTAALALDPTLVDAYRARGSARARLRDFEGAITDYSYALTLAPGYAALYYERGRARFRQGDLARAIADFDAALRLDPTYALAYARRGFARARQGDEAGALADYSAAAELNPSLDVARYGRVVGRLRAGDPADADYRGAQSIAPTTPEGYTNRGLARAALGDTTGAVADFEQAARLFTRVGEHHSARFVTDKAAALRAPASVAGGP